MIIVLEGPDFAGKSTLAHQLVEALDDKITPTLRTRVVHNGQDKELTSQQLFIKYVGQVANAIEYGGDTIFDRLHVGEVVYGPKYRGDSRLSPAQIVAIGQLLDDAGAIKVHVDADDLTLLDRFRGTRGDDLVTEEADLKQIALSYRQLLTPGISIGGDREKPWTRWLPEHSAVAGLLEVTA